MGPIDTYQAVKGNMEEGSKVKGGERARGGGGWRGVESGAWVPWGVAWGEVVAVVCEWLWRIGCFGGSAMVL